MNMIEVTMVRVYITESSKLLRPICDYLQKEVKIHGISVFRAISGVGESSATHTSFLTDLSLDLLLIIEFFDNPEKITVALDHLNTLIKAEHIVIWKAHVNDKNINK